MRYLDLPYRQFTVSCLPNLANSSGGDLVLNAVNILYHN